MEKNLLRKREETSREHRVPVELRSNPWYVKKNLKPIFLFSLMFKANKYSRYILIFGAIYP